MELANEQTSKVPWGRFWLSVIGLQHTEGSAEWKYTIISNMSLLEIYLGKIKAVTVRSIPNRSANQNSQFGRQGWLDL